MKKLFSTKPYETEDEDGQYAEAVHIFEYETEDEAEDFQILSHNEQLSMCGFKEERTPSKGTVHRYVIDPSDIFVVIRETTMTW